MDVMEHRESGMGNDFRTDDDDLLKLLVSNINCTSRFKYEKGYCDDCKEEVEIEEYEE